jgi:hypothetical protein
MLVVRVTENVRAVQSSYYSSCPWVNMPEVPYGVPAGSLCHVQQSTVVKPDIPLEWGGSSVPMEPK